MPKLTGRDFRRLGNRAVERQQAIAECETYDQAAALLIDELTPVLSAKQAKNILDDAKVSLKAKEPPSLESRVKELEANYDRLLSIATGATLRLNGIGQEFVAAHDGQTMADALDSLKERSIALEKNLEEKSREIAQLRAMQNARPAVIFPPVRGSTPDSIPIQDRHDAIM